MYSTCKISERYEKVNSGRVVEPGAGAEPNLDIVLTLLYCVEASMASKQ